MTSSPVREWMKEALRIAAIVGAGLMLALPDVALGFPRLAHDGDINVLRASLFSSQFWDGNLYPRWLADANAGLGSPTFYFYPPLPFYVASLFRPFSPSDPDGWFQVGWAAALALIGSGLCGYVWWRGTAGPGPALAAAILYVAAPYHVAVDLYARGALAELWAFVWMPFILFCARGLSVGQGLALPGLALGFSLLVMSHPPSVLIFLFIPILHALLDSGTRRRSSVLGATLGAILLGGGLSAFYWIPAVMTQNYASFHVMETGRLHYADRFLFTRMLEWNDFDTKVSWVTLDTLVLALCAAIVACGSGRSLGGRETRFWVGVALSSWFMTTPLSAPIWRAIPLLPKLQFPFRFNVLLAVATGALLAACFRSLPRPCPARVRGLLVAIFLTIAASVVATARSAWSRYPGLETDPEHLASIRERLELRMEGDEVRPRWAMPLRAGNLKPFLLGSRSAGGDIGPVFFLVGTGRLTARHWKPGDILIEVDSGEGGRLEVRQFYYPGWNARLKRVDRELAVVP